MGSGESTPRRVTVENDDQDTIGVVKISEALLKDSNNKENTSESLTSSSSDKTENMMQDLLEQKKELDYQQEKIDDLLQDAFEQGRLVEHDNLTGLNSAFVEENLRKSLEEKDNEIADLRQKRKDFEEEQMKKSIELEKMTAKEFNDGIEYLEKRYSGKASRPVCPSLQSQVLKCYERNTKQALKCSQLVKAYVECVEHARKTMIRQKR